MEVLLKADVEGVGQTGDIKRVADGYAVNFLIPRGLAVIATGGARKQAEQLQRQDEKHRAKEHNEAEAMAARIAGTRLQFTAKAGEKNRLYGSITSGDIAEALERATGLTVDRRRIELEHSIKELGAHQLSIRLAPSVKATFTVEVASEDGDEEPAGLEPSEEAESAEPASGEVGETET